MTVSRRPALESDVDFCRDVHHRAYREVCERQFGPWNEKVQDAFFHDDWHDNVAGFEIILCDGVPSGYMRVETESWQIRVHELVIEPYFQNQGVGSFLLGQILAQADALRVPVRLQTLHQNQAFALYQRIGFRECGRTATHILLERISR